MGGDLSFVLIKIIKKLVYYKFVSSRPSIESLPKEKKKFKAGVGLFSFQFYSNWRLGLSEQRFLCKNNYYFLLQHRRVSGAAKLKKWDKYENKR